MNVKEIVDRTVQFFRDKKIESPRLDAELLIARALGIRRIDLYLRFDKPLAEDEVTKCREVVRRRSLGEPVAYILGEKDFFGLTFNVDSRVLVPRPETELLAEAAVHFLKNKTGPAVASKKRNKSAAFLEAEAAKEAIALAANAAELAATVGAVKTDSESETAEAAFEASTSPAEVEAAGSANSTEPASQEFLILDLGCGSGCLGLSIAAQIPHSRVVLVDLSPEALAVAKTNAERLGVQDRCQWIQEDAGKVELGDWEFDVIVANPPYIAPQDPRVQESVAKFEPHLALYANDQGFAAIQDWARHAIANLKETGLIGFEFGSDQGPRAKELFQSLGLSQVRLIQDLGGHQRHVVGLKGQNNG